MTEVILALAIVSAIASFRLARHGIALQAKTLTDELVIAQAKKLADGLLKSNVYLTDNPSLWCFIHTMMVGSPQITFVFRQSSRFGEVGCESFLNPSPAGRWARITAVRKDGSLFETTVTILSDSKQFRFDSLSRMN